MQEEKSKETILTLSASRVKTYQQCPRKYYYNYIERLPRKDWPHFDLGTLVHGALERFHEDFRDDSFNGTPLKKIMKVAFKEERQSMEKNKELAPEILLEARDLLVEYLKNIESVGIGSEIMALEDSFNLDIGEGFRVQGFVDRLDKDADGMYHIKDYKTTKNMKYMEPSQLRVYGLYLLDKFPDVKTFRGSYVMLRHKSKELTYDFTTEDVEKEKQSLLKYARIITEEERWIAKPTRLCDWCDFKDTCLNTW